MSASIPAAKLSAVISDFISERILPGATGNDGFWAGFARGAVRAIGANPDTFVAKRIMTMLDEKGIVDPQGNVDLPILIGGLKDAFDTAGSVSMFGYRLDRGDGDALIALLEKYKNE